MKLDLVATDQVSIGDVEEVVLESSVGEPTTALIRFRSLNRSKALRELFAGRTQGFCVRLNEIPIRYGLTLKQTDPTSRDHVPMTVAPAEEAGLRRVLCTKEIKSLRTFIQQCFSGFATASKKAVNTTISSHPAFIVQGATSSLDVLADLVAFTRKSLFICQADNAASSPWQIIEVSNARCFADTVFGEKLKLTELDVVSRWDSVSGLKIERKQAGAQESAAVDVVADIRSSLPLKCAELENGIVTRRIDTLRLASNDHLEWETEVDVFDENEWIDAWHLDLERHRSTEVLSIGTVIGHLRSENDVSLVKIDLDGIVGTVDCLLTTQSTGTDQAGGMHAPPYTNGRVLCLVPSSFHSKHTMPLVLTEVRSKPITFPKESSSEKAPFGVAPFLSFSDGLTMEHADTDESSVLSLNPKQCKLTKNRQASLEVKPETVEVKESGG